MKKRLQGLIAGVLIGTILTSGVVFAKQSSETINVIYDNIKILIDGKEYQPTDANGNAVEPFIYNGTTYLPVRAIANAFDKEVDWEAQTSTVTLGSKNYDWLDQMGYVDYKTSGSGNAIIPIKANTKDSDNIKYDRGISFKMYLGNWNNGIEILNDGSVKSFQSVEYLLNGKYKEFEGSILFTGDDIYYGKNKACSTLIKFYGDGNLIYTSPIIANGTKTTKFNVNVENYKILKIYVDVPNLCDANSGDYIIPGIADARLSKK